MSVSRRDFVRLGALGAIGASVAPGATLLGQEPSWARPRWNTSSRGVMR
jgi:hypothetical protein